MTQSKKMVAGFAAALVVLFALACAGQPSQDQTTQPEQTTQAPAQQAAPATAPSEGAAAPGTAPAQPQQQPAQGDQPHN